MIASLPASPVLVPDGAVFAPGRVGTTLAVAVGAGVNEVPAVGVVGTMLGGCVGDDAFGESSLPQATKSSAIRMRSEAAILDTVLD